MEKGYIFKDITEADGIRLLHTGSKNKKIVDSLDVRTSVLKKRFGLKPNQEIAWQIPADFPTDGASTPQFIWWIIPQLAWWILFAAIVHDWCWRERYARMYVLNKDSMTIEVDLGVHPISYKEGTQIMFEKMTVFGGPFLLRHMVSITLEIVRKLQGRK